MSRKESAGPELLQAFIKAAQYVVGVKANQDLYEHIAFLVVSWFPASWAAFVERGPDGALTVRHAMPAVAPAPTRAAGAAGGKKAADATKAAPGAAASAPMRILEAPTRILEVAGVREHVAEVLETGFLLPRVVNVPDSSMTVFLPVARECDPEVVMLVGHASAEQVPRGTLDSYLALGSLVETACERQRNAVELDRRRARLEARTKELQEANVALRNEIAERTRATEMLRKSEEMLRQSQKMEAIGTLAGGVAHDFNNLLSVINGTAEMMLRGLNPQDPLAEDLTEMLNAGRKAAALTRHLLAFSRRQVLEPKAIDVNALAAGIERMLRRMIGEDVVLTTAYAPDLGKVWADAGQIEQVLMNLAVNSRDAMPGGGKLTIETRNMEIDETYPKRPEDVKPGRFVLLSVTDTGVGMDEATMGRVFEPFFTTKAKGRGTGLGLATVYGIVRQSGGFLNVYSEVGKGTTFKVYLPAVPLEQCGEAVPEQVRFRGARGCGTILLVEDDDSVRRLTTRVLCSAGYTVQTAANGGEALLLLEQGAKPIDLLITDVVMPHMNGRQLADRLRAVQHGMRVLFTSGYAENAIVHHGVLDPGVHFIAKPASREDLLNKVAEVLAEGGATE